MPKYTYSVQVKAYDKWSELIGLGEESLSFCRGYFFGKKDGVPPILAHRVVRSDGKVLYECDEEPNVEPGMIAGWPTAKQYREAAKRALARADAIDDMNRRCAAREGE